MRTTKKKSEPLPEQYLVEITAPTYKAKLVIENEDVVDCEPRVRWMQYWTYFNIQLYCQKHGWGITITRLA